MADGNAGEPIMVKTGSSPRPFPIRRALLTVAAGTTVTAGLFYNICHDSPAIKSEFESIGITVYAAFVVGIVGLVCAAIFRVTWLFSWSAAARGFVTMLVGGALGAVGGIGIARGMSGTLNELDRIAVPVLVAVLNTIVWTIGGSASPLPRAPRQLVVREAGDRARRPRFIRRRILDLIAILAAVIVDWAYVYAVMSLPPRKEERSEWFGTIPGQTRPEQWRDAFLFVLIVNLSLAVVILGVDWVMRRIRGGKAGPWTPIITFLLLLPFACVAVIGLWSMFLKIANPLR